MSIDFIPAFNLLAYYIVSITFSVFTKHIQMEYFTKSNLTSTLTVSFAALHVNLKQCNMRSCNMSFQVVDAAKKITFINMFILLKFSYMYCWVWIHSWLLIYKLERKLWKHFKQKLFVVNTVSKANLKLLKTLNV